VTELTDQAEIGTGRLHLALGRRLVAEALGTAFLIIAVIGSGIMASRLSPDDVGLQLLENAGLGESMADAGLIANRDGDAKTLAQDFIIGIAQHRHWEREMIL